MVDVRGAYRFRVGLLAAMTVILAATVALGALSGAALLTAVIATGIMGVAAGLWRHLSADYGLSLGIASLLLFFIAMATPGASTQWGHHAVAVLIGGALGILAASRQLALPATASFAANRRRELARCR